MKKSQLISQIVLSANPSFNRSDAIRFFIREFVKHFLDKNVHEWDSEVAPYIARTYLLTIDVSKDIDVKYLVAELDALCLKMR